MRTDTQCLWGVLCVQSKTHLSGPHSWGSGLVCAGPHLGDKREFGLEACSFWWEYVSFPCISPACASDPPSKT